MDNLEKYLEKEKKRARDLERARYTTREVADILGVSMRRVNYMIEHGNLLAKKFGRDWGVSRTSLRNLMRSRRVSRYVKSKQKALQQAGGDISQEPPEEGE